MYVHIHSYVCIYNIIVAHKTCNMPNLRLVVSFESLDWLQLLNLVEDLKLERVIQEKDSRRFQAAIGKDLRRIRGGVEGLKLARMRCEGCSFVPTPLTNQAHFCVSATTHTHTHTIHEYVNGFSI